MRKQGRELALQILFQLEFNSDLSVNDLLQLIGSKIPRDSVTYAQELVRGTQDQREKIDSLIQSASSHWKVNRMAVVDRNILRLAAYEMVLSHDKLSPAVAINEAVEMAKRFGSTESGAFVNGVLDQIAKENP